MDYETKIAKILLKINAIKLNPNNPFTWASGAKMPIYNDNRMLLEFPEHRKLVANAFLQKIKFENIEYDVIAGTSTAGISPATTLADLLYCPLAYVRNEPKKHGLIKYIEGASVKGKRIILIEDLISTGGSSARAVQEIRNSDGECNHCFSIFNYGFYKAVQTFESLNPKCNVHSLLNFKKLLEVIKEIDYFNEKEFEILKSWEANPFDWAKKYGFEKGDK